nr:hypothetical protein [Tanacetum cinerariifolium]
METTIEQQAAMDEALVPHTQSPRLTASAKGKQTAKASKAKSLSALSEVAMTKAQHLKLVTKRSMQQTHISQASSSGADEGTSSIPGDDEHEFDEDESDKETRDEESFDPIPQTPENSEDEGNGEEDLGLNIGEQKGHIEEEEEDEIYRDVNINQRRGIQTNLEVEDSHVTLTPVNRNEANFSEAMQTNQFARAVSAIPGIVQRYMDQRMNDAVKGAVQIQSDRLCDEAQRENEEFLKTVDENMQ